MSVPSARISTGKESRRTSDVWQLVVVRLAGGSFGLDIQNVRGINRLAEDTGIPTAPDYVEGIMNLRRDIAPVVNLGLRFGLARIDSIKD